VCPSANAQLQNRVYIFFHDPESRVEHDTLAVPSVVLASDDLVQAWQPQPVISVTRDSTRRLCWSVSEQMTSISIALTFAHPATSLHTSPVGLSGFTESAMALVQTHIGNEVGWALPN
jgi:hypothetical protein